ncbi:hypothetical protein ACNAN0_05535 [Agrilactobacillus fermenti]|nr:hypothetical protein [Agrilactobacillus fermenti]MCD2257456.1 hypothetical protein [Agrilactobacillus fermenti]
MKFRVQLNTETQVFTVISRDNEAVVGHGDTIQDAIRDALTVHDTDQVA